MSCKLASSWLAAERRTLSRASLPMAILLALLFSQPLSVAGDGGWKTGRATRYGGLDDYWSIHDGSCWHKYLSPNRATGWDVAAIPDTHPEFSWSGHCGICFEVRCKNMNFKDGYGNYLDRSGVCYDSSASLVVQITDTCPCNYPSNAYSNKRWCCNDMPHFDLSTWAFEKLAPKKWGVIGLEYRRVSCKTQPWKKASLPWGEKPSPGHAAPKGWNDNQDPRPWP